MQVLRQSQQRVPGVTVPFSIVDLGTAEDGPGQGVGGTSHGRRLGRHKVAVVEGDLADVRRHVADFAVVLLISPDDGLEEVDGGVANVPLQSVEDMHFHLREHACIVKAAAHVVELVDLWHTVLLVAILGSNQQCCTANELVMLLVDNPLRAVSVEEVDGQEQRFPQQRKGCMCLNQEVDEVWTHKPLDLTLHVDQVGIREGLILLHHTPSVLVTAKADPAKGSKGLGNPGATHLHGPGVLHNVLEVFIAH